MFFRTLFLEPSITQSIVVLTLVVSIGLWLGDHVRLKQFSLGVTWILFAGIALSAAGIAIDGSVSRFAKDFGLILFIYSIGLQMGPSFSPFGKNGLRLNLLAVAIVLLGCGCTIALHFITGTDMGTMAGVMSGAVINTPSLGAAEQAYYSLFGALSPDIATGYAVAYPLGVVGLILSFEIIRRVFHVNPKQENERLKTETEQNEDEPVCVDVMLRNPQIERITLRDLQRLCPIEKMVVSRVVRPDGSDELVSADTTFGNGDTIRVLTDKKHLDALRLLGQVREYSFQSKEQSTHLVSRRIAVTKPECNGKRISSFDIRNRYHATITRINRAGVELLATPELVLQLGDRLVVVGDKDDVQRVADTFGNELKRLDLPNLLPIFVGIFLGVIVGSLPIAIPGMSQPFRLGLAGGSLIVAILIGRFGPYYNMVTFATTSANMMLRQVGLTLFLAAVGLSVGEQFIPTIVGGGYMWVLYGFLITVIPLLIVGCIAYKAMHINYFRVVGLLTGAMTGAPALAYAQGLSDDNDEAAVTYATVYPLTMFLRVMAGQVLVLAFC